MLNSMTGYGQGESTDKGFTVSVELRSVNNRFFDLSLKLAPSLRHLENHLREILQKNVERGKINAQINLHRHLTADTSAGIDEEMARLRLSQLEQLRSVGQFTQPIQLGDLIGFTEIFQTTEENPEINALLLTLSTTALHQAINELNAMRLQEGQHLTLDIQKRIDQIEVLVDWIQVESGKRIPEAKEKMTERIKQLLGDDHFDPTRLELEIAILADRLDISEEIVRLQGHLQFFREALEVDQSTGRRLNFLTQEMNREINTIGSKCNHTGIAHTVVELKEILEQIREQIQNIE